MKFCSLTIHSGFQTERTSCSSTKFHPGIMKTETELSSTLKVANHVVWDK